MYSRTKVISTKSKLRISERNTKEKLVFSLSSESHFDKCSILLIPRVSYFAYLYALLQINVCECSRKVVPLCSLTSIITGFVNRILTCLLLFTTLLCSSHNSGAKDIQVPRLQSRLGDKGIQEQIQQSDGWLRQVAEEPQSPAESALRTAPSSHRVASSRPNRLLPTQGGRSSHHHGRWASGSLFHLYKYPPLRHDDDFVRLHRASASPRLYYVIALRRLLC